MKQLVTEQLYVQSESEDYALSLLRKCSEYRLRSFTMGGLGVDLRVSHPKQARIVTDKGLPFFTSLSFLFLSFPIFTLSCVLTGFYFYFFIVQEVLSYMEKRRLIIFLTV